MKDNENIPDDGELYKELPPIEQYLNKEEIWNLYLFSEEELKNNPYFSRLYLWLIKRSKKVIINHPKKL